MVSVSFYHPFTTPGSPFPLQKLPPIHSIRTVTAFDGEKSELVRYGAKIADGLKQSEKTGLMIGAGLGVTLGVMFSSFGLAFWYGSLLIEAGEMLAGDVPTVFFAIIMGAMSLGQAIPNLSNFSKARGAAVHVYEVVDRKPEIDALSEEGLRPASLKGTINFKEARFTYPAALMSKFLRA